MGKIFFLLVRIKIKHMEVEFAGEHPVGAQHVQRERDHGKYEMQGRRHPSGGRKHTGAAVPVARRPDAHVQNVSDGFSVKYYLNLVLVDEEDRRC